MASCKAIVGSLALVASLGYFLDSTSGFSTDISTFRSERLAASNLELHISRLGTHASLYHLLELANSRAEALWFEGRTWSYSALKDGEISNSIRSALPGNSYDRLTDMLF